MAVWVALAACLSGGSVSDAQIFAPGAKLEHLHTRDVRLNSGLTEGPAVAPDGSIYFTDMPFGADDGMILRFDPKTKRVSVFTAKAGKSNGLAFDSEGVLWSCDGADGGGRRLIRWNLSTGTGETALRVIEGKRFNSPNDLCFDVAGRVYFTDPRYGGKEPRELDREAVYRFSPKDGKVIEITREVEKPNGIVLSPNQRVLYIGDHNNGGNRLRPEDPEPKRGAMKVYAFPLGDDGLVSGPRRTVVDFGKQNGADGMTVDEAGNLYIACRRLDRPGILVVSPEGRELSFLETGPHNQTGLFEDWRGIPSNVEFGIQEDAHSLYVTIDKSLYRIRTLTQGFHPQLAKRR